MAKSAAWVTDEALDAVDARRWVVEGRWEISASEGPEKRGEASEWDVERRSHWEIRARVESEVGG